MCRMIAKVSTSETTILDEMLNCPYSLEYLSKKGLQPNNPAKKGKHRDGCGISFVRNNHIEIHKRDKEHAWNESYVKIVEEAKSKIFIAHNRLASEGLDTRVESAHPFKLEAQEKTYVFSHNGTVYDYVDEAKEKNTSDSFIFLEHIISKSKPNTEDKLKKRISAIAQHAKFSSMTAFLMEKDHLMVWRIFDESDLSKLKDRRLYYTMYMKFSQNSVVFASEPLDEENWTLLPNNSFVSVRPFGADLKMEYSLLF